MATCQPVFRFGGAGFRFMRRQSDQSPERMYHSQKPADAAEHNPLLVIALFVVGMFIFALAVWVSLQLPLEPS